MSKAVGVLDSVPSDPQHVKGCRWAGFCPQWPTTCQRLWVCWILSSVVHNMSKAVGVLDSVPNPDPWISPWKDTPTDPGSLGSLPTLCTVRPLWVHLIIFCYIIYRIRRYIGLEHTHTSSLPYININQEHTHTLPLSYININWEHTHMLSLSYINRKWEHTHKSPLSTHKVCQTVDVRTVLHHRRCVGFSLPPTGGLWDLLCWRRCQHGGGEEFSHVNRYVVGRRQIPPDTVWWR